MKMSDALKILVVDDDPDIVDQLTLLLKAEGYQVASASGLDEAEQVLLTIRPDLAIVDLMMEHKDSGFVLCHEIKKLYPETPVIVLTGVKSETGLAFDAASADAQSWVKADRVMDKPVRPEQLKNEMRHLLVRSGKAVPAPAAVHAH
jgi:two-component system alkaline phosphatase synthesis response regulator PhoP